MSQIDQQQFKRSNDTSFMMKSDPHPLSDLVAAELAEPVDPRVSAMAAALAAHYGDASRAVLFYGSCLRMRELERSEEHTSELQSLMRISYAVFCLKKKKNTRKNKVQNYRK